MNANLSRSEILGWLLEEDTRRLEQLWRAADETRKRCVGDAVHLRGLVEISNYCARQCAYCGLRAGNRALPRYRMTAGEVLEAAHQAMAFGFGTVVLQGGEDPGLTSDWVTNVVRSIKSETGLAVTLSLGERSLDELRAWKVAGADRYLLRFETSDRPLFDLIHPGVKGKTSDRIAMLRQLKSVGYETGSGIMVGLPGQSYDSVARDIQLFRELDLDMIGIGPFIPHKDTPLGQLPAEHELSVAREVPMGEGMVYKAVALSRILCPQANIPATTALATLNKVNGRELALQRGANVVMPNLTPVKYRKLYEIYPDKACVDEAGSACNTCLKLRIGRIGRAVGVGPGGRSAARRQALEVAA
jgi:biotin synthase